MAHETFTTYTEVDPNSDITLTDTKCSFDTLLIEADAWVYDDKGVNHFEGDFEHLIDVQATSQAGGFGRANVWSLTNSITDFKSCTDALGLFFTHLGSDVNKRLRLAERYGSTEYQDNATFAYGTTYYLKLKRDETIGTYGRLYCYIYSDTERTTLVDTLQLDLHAKVDFRYLFCIQRTGGTGTGSTLTGFTENLDIQEAPPEIIESDTITLSDSILLNVSLEKILLEDTVTLSEDISFTQNQIEEDSISLTDNIELNVSLEKQISSDTLSLTDAIVLTLYETSDLINDFRMAVQIRADINNLFSLCKQVIQNGLNIIVTAKGILTNIINEIRTKRQEFYNLRNDIRILLSWQVPGDAGFQSLGKEYIKVYINSVEQTDVNIDSISITKSLNSAHTATFELARPYDDTKPSEESEVEIKYHIWTLYKGYITQISQTDNSEHIQVLCQDKYWKRNRDETKYFFVGHKPVDNTEVFYNYISDGLSQCNANFNIGDFVPSQTDLFGVGESDAISTLVTQAGNFAWYYDVLGNKKLWTSGDGDIITLAEQQLGKNIGLYQVISHQLREDIENIINKYRVQMGNRVIKVFNDYGDKKEFASYEYRNVSVGAEPLWDADYEVLAKNSTSGYGFDWHKPSDSELYKDVFTKYSLPFLDKTLETWTDRFPPEIWIEIPFGGDWECNIPLVTTGQFGFRWVRPLTEGFTVDYENQQLIFNQPIYLKKKNKYGELIAIRRPYISLNLWKQQNYSNTEDESQNPRTDIANPLMFFTEKMGDYPETIMQDLNLSNLSIQIGFLYRKISGKTIKTIYYPSWDDTAFALDYANWQLSQHCDKATSGTINITLDSFCYNAIELNKRIFINNILETSLNIESITLNISSFTASLQLQNGRYYKRTISLPSRG